MAEGAFITMLDLSKSGSITQFKSPPNIKRCVFKAGNFDNKSWAKWALSKFGAYTFARTTGVCEIFPFTITYRPFISEITLSIEKCTVLLIKMATPMDLESKFEWKMCDVQRVWSLHWSLRRRWVSWRNTTSDFCSFKCVNFGSFNGAIKSFHIPTQESNWASGIVHQARLIYKRGGHRQKKLINK